MKRTYLGETLKHVPGVTALSDSDLGSFHLGTCILRSEILQDQNQTNQMVERQGFGSDAGSVRVARHW